MTDTDKTIDSVEPTASQLPTSRRGLLQFLSAAAVGSATGTVAAFDRLVEEEFDVDAVDEWVLRLNDPLGYEPEATTAQSLKQAAFARQEPVLDAVSAMDGVSVRRRLWLPNAVLVDALDLSIAALRDIEGVTTVHPNFEVSLPDPADEQQIMLAPDGETTYGLDQIDLPDAREAFGVDGEGTTVSIIDTGADPDHQDIAVDEFLELDDEGQVVWDTLEEEEGPEAVANDPEGHGTHVSGTAVGRNNGPFDIGVAPAADHVNAKVFPGDQRSTTFVNIAAGLEWSVDAGADVANLSLGGAGFFPGYVEPVRTLTDLGVHVVASSGNDGPATGGSPGNVFESTAVGATDDSEDVAEFSSGRRVFTPDDWDFEGFEPPTEWPTFYTVPSISAPGVDVISAQTGTEEAYVELSGTSMAAPHTAGLVALLRASEDLTVGETQDLLAETAVHPVGFPFGVDDPDSDDPERVVREDRNLPGVGYGFGIVNAYNAFTELEEAGRVTGMVTLDGEPAVGIEVRSDWGTETVSTRGGSYSLPVPDGDEVEITAEAFGLEATETVAVDGETELDIELEPVLDLALRQGQPPDMAAGDAFDIRLDVANLEGLEVDTVEVPVAVDALLEGDDPLYQVDLHPTDDEGNLVPDEFVGATNVLSGAVESAPFTLEDSAGNPVVLDPDEYVAMIHIVDDPDAEEGEYFGPGTFPVLPRATPDDELVGTGVTDEATIEQDFVTFQDQAIDLADAEAEGAHVVIEDVLTEGAEGALIVTYEAFGEGDEVVVDLENEGADAWEVVGVSGGTDTVEHVVEEDQFNPTLLFAEGVEYTFEGLPGDAHPLEFLGADGTLLLSQDGDGEFEDDPDVGWENSGDEVSFTATGELLDDLAEYRCAIHTGSMVGDVSEGTGLVIAGLEIDVFGDPQTGPVDVSVAVEDQGGFPGPHTAHLALAADLSGDYDIGDTVSAGTAEEVLLADSGTAFAAELDLPDQVAGGPEVTLELAGEEIPAGERVDIDEDTPFDAPFTGEDVPLTVTVEAAGDGTELTLDHAFDGLDAEVAVETGPTTVLVDPEPAELAIAESDLDGVVGADGLLDSAVTVENTGDLTALDELAALQLEDIDGVPVQAFPFPLPDLGPGEDTEVDLGPILFGVGAFPRQEATQVAHAGATLGIDPGTGLPIVDDSDDQAAAEFDIWNAEFVIDGFDAPDEAVVNSELEVTVTVTNQGELPAVASFEFEFDGLSVASVEEPVPAGETVDIPLTVPTDGLAPGVYEHGIVPTADEFADGPVFETIELVAPEGPPQIHPSFDGPPQDLTGDGLFEDINGDGTFDILDVQALFDNLDSDPVQNHPAAFNFSGLDSDRVTIFDVQALFTRLSDES